MPKWIKALLIIAKIFIFLLLPCFNSQDCPTPELCYSQSLEKLMTASNEYNYALYLYEKAILSVQDYKNALEAEVLGSLENLAESLRKTTYPYTDSLISDWQKQYLPATRYRLIINKQTGQCMTSAASANPVTFTACSSTSYNTSQKWFIYNWQDGLLSILSETNMSLDNCGGYSSAGNLIKNWAYFGGDIMEHFFFIHMNGGFHLIPQTTAPGMCVQQNITQASLIACNWNDLTQKFDIVNVD